VGAAFDVCRQALLDAWLRVALGALADFVAQPRHHGRALFLRPLRLALRTVRFAICSPQSATCSPRAAMCTACGVSGCGRPGKNSPGSKFITRSPGSTSVRERSSSGSTARRVPPWYRQDWQSQSSNGQRQVMVFTPFRFMGVTRRFDHS
jgi:hypothetical protein